MGTVLDFGAGALLALVWWVVFFAIATLVVNVFVVRACRKRLKRAGRPAGAITAGLVLVLCVALPLFAGYMGVSFSLQRTAAHVLDKASGKLVDMALDRGLTAGKRELGVKNDDEVIPIGKLREVAKARRGATNLPITRFPEILERTFWRAADLALNQDPNSSQGVRWGDLEPQVKNVLTKEGNKVFKPFSDHFRKGARNSLIILVLVLVVLDGAALIVVARMARPKAVPPAAPPAKEEPAPPKVA